MSALRSSFLFRQGRIIFLLLFFALVAVGVQQRSDDWRGAIWSDAEGYYMYLPAVFIYQDLHKVPQRTMNDRLNERGEHVMKYTCGVAVLELPFFLAAHAWCLMTGVPADGFSTPYCIAVLLCGICWSLVGLYVLRKLLLRYFSPAVTWLTLACVFLGTNLFYYSVKETGMSHCYSFTLFAIVLLLTDNYYKKPSAGLAMAIGGLVGWIVMIRPTNIVLLAVVLLYRVQGGAAFRERLRFLRQHAGQLAAAIPFFLLAQLPQMLYWKEMTGHWINYSYAGESFVYWSKPKIAEVLFDTQNGLLLYSPILLLFPVGLVIGRKDRRTSSWATLLSFVLITYLFASWWAWWFGQAFGHRCYVEWTTVLAFPMAIVLERVTRSRSIILKAIVLQTLAFLIYYNLRLTYLFDYYDLPWDGQKWQWNFKQWHKLWELMFRFPPH